MEAQPCQNDWLKVTAQEREDCYHERKTYLIAIAITHRGYALSKLQLNR